MARSILEQITHPKYPRLKLQIRARSRFWQAVTFLDGRKPQRSLKTSDPETALKIAEGWYKKLLRASVANARQHPIDRLTSTPTIAELYANYRGTLSKARREYCDTKWGAVAPFWRTVAVTDVTAQMFRDYFKTRRRHKTQYGEMPTNSTLAKDTTLLRAVLKYAIEEGHIAQLPPIPKPGKIEANPRPWFTHEEFLHLVNVANDRIVSATNKRTRAQRQDLYDFVIAMTESCMRVGEMQQLAAGQIQFKDDYALVDVRGKRGHRQSVVGGMAVQILKQRAEGLKPGDRLWRWTQRDGFANLLEDAKLTTDAFGNPRNAKALRCTGISFKILAGAPSPNLIAISRNVGTSVETLDRYYVKRLTGEMFAGELAKSAIV